MVDLIVVGAGLSGLALAKAAAARGADVLILEARPRIGGRALSHRTAAGAYDLGPAWVWPSFQPRIAEAVRAAGLTLSEQFESGGFVFEDERGLIQRLPHGFVQEPPSMRVVGGVTALADAFAAGLPQGAIRLEHEVRRIALAEFGVEVEAQSPAGSAMLRAGRVALALPPRLVCRIAFQPALPPPVSSALSAVPGWMTGQAKALALYDRPLWREAGLSGGAFSRRGPLGEIHDASLMGAVEAALVGFFCWPAQLRAARRGELAGLVAGQLGALFGPEAGRPRELIVQDWAREPFTATEADATPLARHPDYRPIALPAPWSERIALAGAELAPEFGGYLEGALAAAEAASFW